MLGPIAVFLTLAALSAAAIAFCYARDYTLYYGDAAAHLNIARRIVDSRTPGWEQIGTVWLPLPHVLMLPLVSRDSWWQTGLAGAVPSGMCFVIAGVFFFLALRRLFGSAPAAAGCLLLALNPNLLYLQSIPMTEAVALAALTGVLYFTVRFRQQQGLGSAIGAGLALLAGSLTRYEAWFLIPFVAAYFFVAGRPRRSAPALLCAALASLGPLWWLGHNWWYFGDPLEFYSGPYSAKAIYQRALDAGMARYPGDGELVKAGRYFGAAVRLVAGWPLLVIGLAGAVVALLRRVVWPVGLLALLPVFYVASMYSSGTPIFVPHLWPHSYYNTRYGLVALALLALGGAALAALAPARRRVLAGGAIVLVATAPWLAYPRPQSWICWQESKVNSDARRAWTGQAADFLRTRYRPRDGVFTSFGDLTGIFQQAGIPLRETLHEGNYEWMAAVNRPDLFLREQWVVAISGDTVATALLRNRKRGPHYDLLETVAINGAPVIEIYRRVP